MTGVVELYNGNGRRLITRASLAMITIDLEPAQQQRLDSLAESQGEDARSLARRILLDYLDFQLLPSDTAADWAEASVALAPEVMGQDSWDETGHGS